MFYQEQRRLQHEKEWNRSSLAPHSRASLRNAFEIDSPLHGDPLAEMNQFAELKPPNKIK